MAKHFRKNQGMVSAPIFLARHKFWESLIMDLNKIIGKKENPTYVDNFRNLPISIWLRYFKSVTLQHYYF